MRRRAVLPLLVALSVLAAGCGSDGERAGAEPALPPALAEELAARSDEIASGLEAGDACAARAAADELQQRTIAAVNSGRVPPRYQEELLSSVTALAASIECVITPPTTPESVAPPEADDDDDKGKKKGKGKKG